MKTPTRTTAGAICVRAILATLPLVFFAATVEAQTQIIYDNAMQNAWDGPNYSYGGGFDFASTVQFHSAPRSISLAGNNYNAISFARTAAPLFLTTAQYPVLHFWIYGGENNQPVRLFLQRNNAAVKNAPIDTYIAGGHVVAGAWSEVTVTFASAPLSYAGEFDRIDLQSDSVAMKPVFYIDDVDLRQAGAPPAVNQIVFEHDIQAPVTAVDATEKMNSDIITWYDAGALPRKATLAHDSTAHFYALTGTIYGVAMREFQYQLSNGTPRVAGYTRYGNGGFGGFGYVTDHSSRIGGCAVNDDSPLGDQFPPSGFQRIFEGRHHAIYRMTQNYRRNCATTAAAAAAYSLPVTIDWVFSTGHDNPLWAITYDVDLAFKVADPNAIAPVGTFWDDSRAPYGEFGIDGAGFTNISGVAWGDYRRFTSDPNAVTLTLDSPWTWNTANTVPFVKEWIKGPLDVNNQKDATMGIVQTQTNAQQDAGGARDPGVGSDIRILWDTASGPANLGCPVTNRSLPCPNDWPYQALANSLEFEPAGTANARMTWKTQYGFIGQDTYALNDLKNGSSGTAPGYRKKSYSTYIVLGQHSTNPEPVDDQVAQIETVQTVTFTNVLAGSVVTSGPAGIVRADAPIMYQPAGYNHVYGALAFNAAGNTLDVTINVGVGTLKKPLIIIGSYTGADPVVKLGGAALVADADFFASLRPGANELWITLNRGLTGNANQLQINPPAGLPAAPTGLVATATSTASITISWNAVAGANTYQVERRDPTAIPSGFLNLVNGSTNQTTLTDNAVNPGRAYLYRVHAVNGAGDGPASAADLSTTVNFFSPPDFPLTPMTLIKGIHVGRLRDGVDAVRYLAGLAPYAFTDDPGLPPRSGPVGLAIKAVHVNELRGALDPALQLLNLPFGNYSAGVGVLLPVQAQHFDEIHERMK